MERSQSKAGSPYFGLSIRRSVWLWLAALVVVQFSTRTDDQVGNNP